MNTKPTTTQTEIDDAIAVGKTMNVTQRDTDCGGCENGECDNCGFYACCNEDLIGEATDVKRGWPTCRCGCKARTQNTSSVYLPGHDARHAGQVARAAAARVIETTPTGRPLTFAVIDDEDMLDGLSPALKAKATAHIQRLLDKRAAKDAKVVAKSEKVAVAQVQRVGSVKIGRWTYPVRNAAGLAQRNTKRDGSGEWVAVEPSQIVTYN